MFKPIIQVTKTVFKGVGSHSLMTFAAAIAFYTLFSLPGLLVTVVIVAGIFLGNDPDTILRNLHEHNYGVDEIDNDPSKLASSHDYAGIVTQIDADTPARFNANPDKLHETSGSAGKVVVFAVRLDTFEKERNTRVYYIGSNNTHELSDLRKQLLTEMSDLPLSGEYIHRDAYALAAEYGASPSVGLTPDAEATFTTELRCCGVAPAPGRAAGGSRRCPSAAARTR